MENTVDGSVIFNLLLDATKFSKNADLAKKKLQDLAKSGKLDINKLNTVLKEVAPNLSSFIEKIESIGGAAGPAGAAIVGAAMAIKGMASIMTSTTEAFKMQEKAEQSLQAAARNNPYLNSEGVTQLKQFASELQAVSNVGDETSIKLMAQLASNGRTQQEIQKIMKASIDLSSSGIMGLEEAVKALNGTYSGVTGQLARQVTVIKDLTTEELKRGAAVDLIAEKYKGMAQANIDTKTQAENAIGDLKEQIGGLFNPTMDLLNKMQLNFANALFPIINKINKWGDEISDKGMKKVTDRMEEAKRLGEDWYGTIVQFVQGLNEADLDRYLTYFENAKKKGKELNEIQKGFMEELEAENRIRQNRNKLANRGAEIEETIKGKSLEELKVLQQQEKQFSYMNKSEEEIQEHKARTVAIENNINKIESERKALIKESSKATEEAIKKVEEEARIRGEEVDKQKILDILYNQYLTLMEKGAGILDKNSEEAKKLKTHIEELRREIEKETTTEERRKQNLAILQKALELNKELVDGLKQNSEKEVIDETNLALAELNKAIDNCNLADINKELGTNFESKEGLKKALEEEAEAISKLTRIQDFNTRAGEVIGKDDPVAQKRAELEEIQRLEEEYRQLELEGETNLQYSITELTEAEVEKRKELSDLEWTSRMEGARGYVDYVNTITENIGQTFSQLSNLLIEDAEAEKDQKIKALDEQYSKGLMSDEEYAKKKEKIDKEAANKEYQLKMWQWANNLIMAGANMASSIVGTLASTPGIPGIVLAAIVGALGAVQVATIAASKPNKPSFATGGIVGGSSYTGDRIEARVNSGEMILNRGQQKALWDMINGRDNSNNNAGGGNITINNTQSNKVDTRAKMDDEGNTIIDIIDNTVNKGFASGKYDNNYKTIDIRERGISFS